MASLTFLLKRRGFELLEWVKIKNISSIEELNDAAKLLGAEPLSNKELLTIALVPNKNVVDNSDSGLIVKLSDETKLTIVPRKRKKKDEPTSEPISDVSVSSDGTDI